MGRTALASPTTAVVAAPATLLGILPSWFLITILAVSAALTAVQVIVTQVIRLRASSQIATSAHALQLLTVEDTAGFTPQTLRSRRSR